MVGAPPPAADLVFDLWRHTVSVPALAPWGLSRMKPYPETEVLNPARLVLDAESQTGRWVGLDGNELPELDRHKRSQTNSETKVQTSLDSNPDQGEDQRGDED